MTSSVRQTRSGIEDKIRSSSSLSSALNSPSVRHSPGWSGGRHSRSRFPSDASSPRPRRSSGANVVHYSFWRPFRNAGRHRDEIVHGFSSLGHDSTTNNRYDALLHRWVAAMSPCSAFTATTVTSRNTSVRALSLVIPRAKARRRLRCSSDQWRVSLNVPGFHRRSV